MGADSGPATPVLTMEFKSKRSFPTTPGLPDVYHVMWTEADRATHDLEVDRDRWRAIALRQTERVEGREPIA